LDWGWNPEDMLADNPLSEQNAYQNRDENRKTSLAEGTLGRGKKWRL
jgi:hypothetical protein